MKPYIYENVLGITNDVLRRSAVIVKYRETFGLQMEKNLDITKTRYKEHIFGVRWP